MARQKSVAQLEAQREDLQRQLKQLDAAIKHARQHEEMKKREAVIAALLESNLSVEDAVKAIKAAANKPPAASAISPEVVADM